MNRIARSAGYILISSFLLATTATQAVTAKITAYQRESSTSYDRSLALDVGGTAIRLLLNPSYVTAETTVLTALGQPTSHQNTSYTGIVDGEKNSWVRLSISKTKLTGVFSKQGHRFEIDTDRLGKITIEPLAENHEEGNPNTARRSRNILAVAPIEVTRLAKIAIVVDSQYNDTFSGSGLDKALSIINAVDGIYREEFGLGLQVTKVLNIVNRQNDPFNYGPVPIEQMLRNFREYRMNSQDLSDVSLVHLFTGNPNTDEPVGLAWIDTACRTDGYDVGISTPYLHDILLAAHEIAHNLGAQHDTDTACAVQQDKVMWPYISSNTSQYFSSCTLESVAASLENSCHTETIDLQVSLQQSNSASDTITAVVKNNDLLRANPSAVLSIDLPQNSSATALEGDCNFPDNDLKCDIGTLLPGEEETIIVQLSQIEELSASVHFTVENNESADPNPENNLVSININNGAITALNPQPIADLAGGNSGDDINTGIGAMSLPGLFLILFYLRLATGNRRRLVI